MSARTTLSIAAGLLLTAMTAYLGLAAAAERWAAIAPNNEASSTVVWATSKDQAKRLAIDACQDVSSTCASNPASTNDMSHYFAIMCCTKPQEGCAASVGSSRKEALSIVKKTLSDADYSSCKLKSYIKAGTGEKS